MRGVPVSSIESVCEITDIENNGIHSNQSLQIQPFRPRPRRRGWVCKREATMKSTIFNPQSAGPV